MLQIFFGTYLKSILKILRAKYPYALVFYSQIFWQNVNKYSAEIVGLGKLRLLRPWSHFFTQEMLLPFLAYRVLPMQGSYPSFYWIGFLL